MGLMFAVRRASKGPLSSCREDEVSCSQIRAEDGAFQFWKTDCKRPLESDHKGTLLGGYLKQYVESDAFNSEVCNWSRLGWRCFHRLQGESSQTAPAASESSLDSHINSSDLFVWKDETLKT